MADILMTKARTQAIAALAASGGEIRDGAGRATVILGERMGRTGKPAALSSLLRSMEQDGLIEREVRGRRTLAIRLIEPCPDPRYAQVIADAKRSADVDQRAAQAPAKTLDRLGKVQARLDAERAAETAEAGRELAERGTVTIDLTPIPAAPEPQVEPVASSDPVNYDQLAARLLERVLEVSSQDASYTREELERVRQDLGRARADMRNARDEALRHKTRLREVEEELALTRDRLVEARRGIRERDDNIAKMTADHRKAVSVALSDNARRELERTMTEAPRGDGR